MSQTHDGVKKFNKSIPSKRRRRAVIERLEAQLQLGTKLVFFERDGGIWEKDVQLTEHDIKRIKKEITTLKTRII